MLVQEHDMSLPRFDGVRECGVLNIIENPEEVQRLSQMTMPELWDGRSPLMITQGLRRFPEKLLL